MISYGYVIENFRVQPMNLKKSLLFQLALPILVSAATPTCLAEVQLSDIERGYELLHTGHPEEARKFFESAVKANPKNSEAYLGLAKTELGGTKSIDWCTKAIEIDPNWADAYSARAGAYLSAKQYQQAVDDYTKVIDLHPTKLIDETIANQYVLRGDAFDAMGQQDKAIADFSTAIRLAEDTKEKFWAYQKRAWVFEFQNKYKESVADFDSAIELSPKLATAYSNRGNVELRFKKFNNAITDYTKALSLDPKDGRFYSWRANAYHAIGRNDLAEKDLKLAAKNGYTLNRDSFSSSSEKTIKKPALKEFVKGRRQ